MKKAFLLSFVLAGAALAAPTVRLERQKLAFDSHPPDMPVRHVTIAYPTVSGGVGAAARAGIDRALSLKSAFGESPEQLKAEAAKEFWLLSIDYKVLWNHNDLISVGFVREGMGAYPNTDRAYANVDARSGQAITPETAFTAQGRQALVARFDAEMHRHVAAAKAKRPADERKLIDTQTGSAHFHAKDLRVFSLSAAGVTFHYDWGFAHAIQALEPDGDFVVKRAELRRYVSSSGPLARF